MKFRPKTGGQERDLPVQENSEVSLQPGEDELKTEPMALSLDYWEQIGNAQRNLLDLQCWAKSVGINKVVEPSIMSSGMSVFHFVASSKRLNFGDFIDKNRWEKITSYFNFSQLVTLEHFLEQATKELVFIQIRLAHSDRTSKTSRRRGYCELLGVAASPSSPSESEGEGKKSSRSRANLTKSRSTRKAWGASPDGRSAQHSRSRSRSKESRCSRSRAKGAGTPGVGAGTGERGALGAEPQSDGTLDHRADPQQLRRLQAGSSTLGGGGLL